MFSQQDFNLHARTRPSCSWCNDRHLDGGKCSKGAYIAPPPPEIMGDEPNHLSMVEDFWAREIIRGDVLNGALRMQAKEICEMKDAMSMLRQRAEYYKFCLAELESITEDRIAKLL